MDSGEVGTTRAKDAIIPQANFQVQPGLFREIPPAVELSAYDIVRISSRPLSQPNQLSLGHPPPRTPQPTPPIKPILQLVPSPILRLSNLANKPHQPPSPSPLPPIPPEHEGSMLVQ
ncbi:hypothetical protein PABG_12607 [Paracoccidioides brasiliensis Pb03]|nr:hypothetical protein PABG_12607 [Paracoccidioides brasiliensis Pb03]